MLFFSRKIKHKEKHTSRKGRNSKREMHMKGMYKPGGVRKGWEEEKGGEQSLGRAFKEARRERKKKKKKWEME